jgi:peptidoglycan L-alanyl-D-glutamate endopeptidase CwlK
MEISRKLSMFLSVRIFGRFANTYGNSYTEGMESTLPIIDSAMSFEEAVAGREFPSEISASLALVDVQHIGFDGYLHQGQLIVHRDLADEVKHRFAELLDIRFPIEKVIPIVKYDWDDEASMQDNNTSAFNYRVIFNTDRLSHHSRGRAIDINPKLNPCTASNGMIQPRGGVYDVDVPGTLLASSKAVAIFVANGWTWLGGRSRKDWQHFEKDTQQQ